MENKILIFIFIASIISVALAGYIMICLFPAYFKEHKKLTKSKSDIMALQNDLPEMFANLLKYITIIREINVLKEQNAEISTVFIKADSYVHSDNLENIRDLNIQYALMQLRMIDDILPEIANYLTKPTRDLYMYELKEASKFLTTLN